MGCGRGLKTGLRITIDGHERDISDALDISPSWDGVVMVHGLHGCCK